MRFVLSAAVGFDVWERRVGGPATFRGWRAPEDRGKGGTKKEVSMKSGNAAKPAPQLTLQLRRVPVAGRSLEQV